MQRPRVSPAWNFLSAFSGTPLLVFIMGFFKKGQAVASDVYCHQFTQVADQYRSYNRRATKSYGHMLLHGYQGLDKSNRTSHRFSNFNWMFSVIHPFFPKCLKLIFNLSCYRKCLVHHRVELHNMILAFGCCLFSHKMGQPYCILAADSGYCELFTQKLWKMFSLT